MSIFDAKQLKLEGKVVKELTFNGEKVYPMHEEENSRLPKGYTELEYIESADSQYIDSKVRVNPQYTVLAEYMITQRKTTWDTIFGTRNGNLARFTARFANTTGGVLGLQRSTSKTASNQAWNDGLVTKTKATDKFHQVLMAKNKYYYDGTLRYTFTAGSSLTKYDYSLFFFANNNAGSVGDEGYFRMRLITIQDENGAYVRHYIPCTNPDGVAGMYDLITSEFYGSNSAKAFIAGPVKEAA